MLVGLWGPLVRDKLFQRPPVCNQTGFGVNHNYFCKATYILYLNPLASLVIKNQPY
jgi:hypothetical protein